MARKTIWWNKTHKCLDFSHNEEYGATIIKVGKHFFTMKKFIKVFGHDDSLPYNAILCIDGKPMYQCFNDGWGGETIVRLMGDDKELHKQIVKELKDYSWTYEAMKFELRLDFIADILANTCDLILKKISD